MNITIIGTGYVGFITSEQLEKLAQPLAKNGYGQYLLRLLNEGAQP
jgi:glucose-1-phosphate thymidylyltransferase